MDKKQILALLHELGDELANEESYATINVCGGAAMAMIYDINSPDDDIDVVLIDFDNRNKFNECVKRVANHYNLPESWLNEDVKIFVNSMKEPCFQEFDKFGTLSIRIISEEQLLAMKLFAARRKDLDDAVVIAKSLCIVSKEELNNVLYKYFNERSVKFMAAHQKQPYYTEIFQDEVINKLPTPQRFNNFEVY